MSRINGRKIKLNKLNNQGSTFVLALIIITLITTLAVAILGASANNIAMKGVDRNSKTTFYTAESVLDEIRAGVGLDSMNYLAKSYETVLTNIIKDDPAGYSYIMDNDSANEEFKSIFVESMLNKMTSGEVSFASGSEEVISSNSVAKENVISYLENFIVGYDEGMADITSIGAIEAYKDSDLGITYFMVIRDVAVSYKEQKAGETYFSNVTADLEVQFPNMTVDFSSSNRLDNFTDYALIADDDILVQGCEINAQNSIYAGGTINVIPSAIAGGKLNLSTGAGSLDTSNIVCGGNTEGDAGSIKVMGSGDFTSAITASGVDIWCANITTLPVNTGGSDVTKGVTVTIDELCNTYVKDDLTINGANSELEIEGQYYGYSYDGYDDSVSHAASSAVIINAERAKLTIGTSKMIIGGHAYVELGSEEYYSTGEALSFKGDQEIYLVPSAYLAKNYEVSVPNPMPKETWEDLEAAAAADADIKICDIDGFFADKKGYLASKPYTVKKSGELVYLYLNFIDKDAAADYVYDVANGTNGAPASLGTSLDKYTANLFQGADSGYVITSESAQIYTKGALLTTGGTSAGTTNGITSSTLTDIVAADSGQTLANDEFVLTSMDLTNRYNIISHLLADLPWTDSATGKKYIVNDIDSALWQMENYLISGGEMNTSNIFNVIVDSVWLEDNPYNPTGAYVQYGEVGGTDNYIKIAIEGDYIVPDDCTGGIIVATGNVLLTHDFHGMIIAGKSVNLLGNATITSNRAMIEYLINNEPAYKNSEETEAIPFKEYFYAYKHAATEDDSREQVKVETVDYKDLVNFNNWRKYED